MVGTNTLFGFLRKASEQFESGELKLAHPWVKPVRSLGKRKCGSKGTIVEAGSFPFVLNSIWTQTFAVTKR